ncbi:MULTISPECIES: T9SS type A sorting domain-containing protein [unclassified Carboxylicivirga]|uniref:T9SS type A sorting domain-containing protein n=1 Tax=Carboxylicivirga TaxID=1628153 RepID=UPI003D3357AF
MKRILPLLFLLACVGLQAADHDLKISRWFLPQSEGLLNATEKVRFEIANLGSVDAVGFKVAYSLDGGQTFVEEDFATTVPAGESRVHTFATLGDFSTDGATYDVIGKIIYTPDPETSNNTITVAIKNKVAGDVCDEPIELNLTAGISYTEMRDISVYDNDYGYSSNFSAPNYLQDRDVIYAFQTTEQYSYLDVELVSNYIGNFAPKPAVHVITACPNGTFSTVGYGTGTHDVSVSDAYLYAVKTYYIVVSKWNTYNFTYDLDVRLYHQTDFKSFGFAGVDAEVAIDYTTHSITATVPTGTDLSGLTPEFSIPAYGEVVANASTLASGTQAFDFSTPQSFTVRKSSTHEVTQDWTVSVSEATPTGLTTNNAEAFTIYPNPVRSTLNVQLSNTLQAQEIKLLNAAGRVVHKQKCSGVQNISIAVNHLSKGIYFVSLEGTNTRSLQKFIKR